jgi:putative transposase
MYAWRQMTASQREEALRERRLRGYPLHGPPHFGGEYARLYHLTAACYEHRAILGYSRERMAAFEEELVSVLSGPAEAGTTNELVVPPSGGRGNGSAGFGRDASHSRRLLVWCVLPTHWHALVRTDDLRARIAAIGRLHGRCSHAWNGEEDALGRTCWHRCADRAMRTEGHVHATVNYVLRNPVHHEYVADWMEWPYSNVREYVRSIGAEEADRRWTAYPVLDYGKGWDDPEM